MSEAPSREPSGAMTIVSALLMGLSVLLGWVLGDTQAVVNSSGDKVFNWTLAAVVFGPLFLAGVVLYAASEIIEALHD